MPGHEHHLLSGELGQPPMARTASPVGGTKDSYTKVRRGPFTLYRNQRNGFFQVCYQDQWLPGMYVAEYVAMLACGVFLGLGADPSALERLWRQRDQTQPALTSFDLQSLVDTQC